MTKSRVLVATPLGIATAVRQLVIDRAKHEAAKNNQDFTEPNGSFKSWCPVASILEVLACCKCNMQPVMNDEMTFERQDGAILATHKSCTHGEINFERDARVVAEWLNKSHPHLLKQGALMLNKKQPAAPTKHVVKKQAKRKERAEATSR